MDATLRSIVDFATNSSFQDLPDSSVKAVHRHILDGVGCAAGALHAPPVSLVRTFVAGQRSDQLASVYGLPQCVDVQFAAFANITANRYLDFNDTYVPGPGGHPNDMVPALFALAEANRSSGEDLMLAVYLAYEVFGTITRSTRIRDRGWDQGFQCAVGIAAAGSRLLGLSSEASANAVSLAITPNIPLRVVRTGELSHWKGCATAYAGMASVLALRLTACGLTGPPDVFEGTDGVFAQVTGEFDMLLGAGETSVVEETLIKQVPAELSTQVPVQLAQEIRPQLIIADIESIAVFTHHLGWHETGGAQGDAAAKWDPRTRETADHSLPYIIATVLRERQLTPASFDQDRIERPGLRPLMRKVSVHEDPAITRGFDARGEVGARLEVRMTSGRVLTASAAQPRGAPEKPLSDAELMAKIEPMLREVLPREQGNLTVRLWALEKEPHLDAIGSLVRAFG